MKFTHTPQIALTKEERDALLSLTLNPVCNLLNCDEVSCRNCPFNKVTDEIKRAVFSARCIAANLPTYKESE